MRVLVTGAGGFIGRALVARLRGGAGADDKLRVTDVDDGDIADPTHVARLFAAPVDRVFHLAGVVSGAAEGDVDTAERVNVLATLELLRSCRRQHAGGGPLVRFVCASSIAVFGVPLPNRIDDATEPMPTLSYGTHKRVCELLIDDASRRGDVDGRAMRLAGVVVRPRGPHGARSAFNSDLIREPLAGREVVCPVGPQATIWVVSRQVAVDNLLRCADVDATRFGATRAITAPALAVTVADVVAAVARVDASAATRVRFDPQPQIEDQFGRWPLSCTFERARALGLSADASLDAIVAHHLASPSP